MFLLQDAQVFFSGILPRIAELRNFSGATGEDNRKFLNLRLYEQDHNCIIRLTAFIRDQQLSTLDQTIYQCGLPDVVPRRRMHDNRAACRRSARDCRNLIRIIEWIGNDDDVNELPVPMFE